MASIEKEKEPLLASPSTTTTEKDKEAQILSLSQQQEPKNEDEESSGPSPRQIFFLHAVLWLCWLVAAFSDILLSVELALRGTISSAEYSPLQRKIIWGLWDVWLYDRFPFLYTPHMVSINTGALTGCALMLIALNNAWKSADAAAKPGTEANRNLDTVARMAVSTLAIVGARYLGCSARETDVIFVPFAWISVTTLLDIGRRMRIGNVGDRLGIEREGTVEQVLGWGSMAVMLGVHAWCYGVAVELVMVLGLWEGVRQVYNRIG